MVVWAESGWAIFHRLTSHCIISHPTFYLVLDCGFQLTKSTTRKRSVPDLPPDAMALPLTRSSSSLSSTSTAHSPTLQPTKAAKSSPTIPKSPLSESKVAIPFGIPIRAQRTLESSLATPLTLIFSHHPQPPSTPIQNSYPGSGSAEDPYLVDWLPGEAANPYNWKSSFRWTVTAIIAVATLCIAFASSSYSAALQDVLVVFPGTKQETGIAGISLYVLGKSRCL